MRGSSWPMVERSQPSRAAIAGAGRANRRDRMAARTWPVKVIFCRESLPAVGGRWRSRPPRAARSRVSARTAARAAAAPGGRPVSAGWSRAARSAAGRDGRRGRGGRRAGVRGRAGGRQDGVVPVAVEAVPGEDPVFQVFHLRVGHLGPGGVAAGVQDGGDGQPGAGGGRGDGVHHDLVAGQRAAPPGAGDVAEQPVLDLVPLACSGREVAAGDLQPGLLREPRQLCFPGPGAVAVRAARVAGDQQPRRMRVAVLADGIPPAADRFRGERRGVVIGADVDEPGVIARGRRSRTGSPCRRPGPGSHGRGPAAGPPSPAIPCPFGRTGRPALSSWYRC